MNGRCEPFRYLWLLSVALWITALCCERTAKAQEIVSQTVHNLSAGGPGQVRAQTEQQICIFCHAPHNTGGLRPLWNRELPAANYQIYQSSTLDANPGQPTGASKLCLSCHDGTIALGSVLSRSTRIRMGGGDFIPAGLTNLGTDLSDDHPISFYYTAGLAASDSQLADPTGLPAEIKLEASGQLQCTACHDPHHNRHGKFLVMSNEFGALCTTCHVMTGWSGGSHRISGAVVSGVSGGDWPYSTVAENACRSCHRAHTAGGHERLLIFENEEDNCLSCHSGQVAGHNILAELDKWASHDPRNYVAIHDPIETPSGSQPHVECVDCHNPHAASAQTPSGMYIPIGAPLAKVAGISQGGVAVAEAQYEYEVCYRCHADSPVPVDNVIVRQAHSGNVRLDFSPTSPSYHPVVNSSPSPDTVSLVPGLASGSLIRCTDCHNNDNGPGAGGGGPAGPHGSAYPFLLERNYTVADDTVESQSAYALCYKCHQQSIVLSTLSFPEHFLHVVEERAPCSACHDPHGVSNTAGSTSDHTQLINFDTTIVRPVSMSMPIQFRRTGRFTGSCTLVCHGKRHHNERYPQGHGGGR